jgi:hypothetical protein
LTKFRQKIVSGGYATEMGMEKKGARGVVEN